MDVTIPAVVLFAAATWLLIRSRTLGAFEATVTGLFGFFLATTGLSVWLTGALTSLLHLHH